MHIYWINRLRAYLEVESICVASCRRCNPRYVYIQPLFQSTFCAAKAIQSITAATQHTKPFENNISWTYIVTDIGPFRVHKHLPMHTPLMCPCTWAASNSNNEHVLLRANHIRVAEIYAKYYTTAVNEERRQLHNDKYRVCASACISAFWFGKNCEIWLLVYCWQEHLAIRTQMVECRNVCTTYLSNCVSRLFFVYALYIDNNICFTIIKLPIVIGLWIK